MKRSIIAVLAIFLLAAVSLCAVGALQGEDAPEVLPAAKNAEVQPLSLEADNAMKARLSQLINLNRAYDDALTSPAALVDEASLVLIDQAEELDGKPVIETGKVLAFVNDLYGVQLDLTSLPQFYTDASAGYLNIAEREYAQMTSEIESVEFLADGSIKVSALMSISSEYSEDITAKTQTIFRQNPASPFGYNIIDAVITQYGEEIPDTYSTENPLDVIDGYDMMSLE